MYDTYVQKTPIEAENNILSSLRGHISITLHLVGIAKELSHFFERHETSVRNETTRRKITKIIQYKKVLDTIINFALYYYTLFVKDGHTLANEILDKFTTVESEIVKVPEGLGFHLRPSTLVAKVANHYGSKMIMLINNKQFDASSVIDIMWAGGMIKKENLTEVEFRGNKNAIRDLKILAEANYGEDTMGNSTPLPEGLSYLRQD
jgi:phosphotransferase system HPr (HPr) family protein